MMRVASWYRKVIVTLAAVASVSLAIMILSTSLDTIFRYSINHPIAGVFELNEVLMAVVVFFGIAWTQRERGHTRVVLVMRKLPIRLAVKLDIVCWILCFLFLGILGFQSGKEALYSFQIGEFRWGSVQMPIWWAKACVPLGCWLTCVQLLIDIWVDIDRLRGRLPLELPDFSQIGD
jgi:TRAP-type C4-dicarboxylate transport system permease small subunit